MIFYNLACTLILIALDRFSKYLAVEYLMGKGTVIVIPNVLGLKYIENTGAAFSILSGKTSFLVLITGIALSVIAYMIFAGKFTDRFEKFCFILILAGGTGNLIDRVLRGFVVDYFELLFMNFAIFNVADVYVCTGLGLYAIYVLYNEYWMKKKGVKNG